MDPSRNRFRGGLPFGPRVAVYEIEANKRSRAIAEAMAEGISAAGDSVHIFPSHCYRSPHAEIAVFYGFDRNLQKVMRDYRAAGKAVVYVDLGYWNRREGGPLQGYHKVSVNGRHPTDYFQGLRHPSDRFGRLGVSIEPWRPGGRHIIVAGMSAKGAEAEGFEPHAWEEWTVAELRKVTDRPIIYRPKPSWMDARAIAGAAFEPGLEDLPRLLVDCHAVVTHHSNVAIDALMAGIPAFVTDGPASALCFSELARIEQPWRPDGREQFAADLAYAQWRVSEMRDGTVWRHLKSEGLIS